jgi:two-component sensor histidine kinase
LREKEALLREVHHRVKNNLQVISSLLSLESARIDNPLTQDTLRDMRNRIRSMALLHESIYSSDSFAQVNLQIYIGRLCNQLFRSLQPKAGLVQLHLDLAPIPLDVTQAVPCGLLINELLSNSLKHGFPNGRSGEIRVQLMNASIGSGIQLRVTDNGIGLPANFDLKNLHSLGLQLVSDLAGQLGGQIEIGAGPGTVFTITFTPQTAFAPGSTS